MADEGAVQSLGKKLGPLPVWAWVLIAVGIYLVLKNQGLTGKSTTATGAQTDPAGNVGTINPATGYVAGSPENTSAMAAQGGGSTDTVSSQATTGAQTYADNNAWGIAAINYLVGRGIDAVTANQAVQNYLNSENLTTAQQGDVNLAIQALGAPPSLPGPAPSNPTGVVGTGSGSGSGGKPPAKTAKPTLSGGHVVSSSETDVTVAWTGTGATQWQVKLTGPGPQNGRVSTVSRPQAVYSGLEPDHTYTVQVMPLVNGKPTGSPGEITFYTAPKNPGKPSKGSKPGKAEKAPTGFAVATNRSRTATLKWNKSSGATGYHVDVTDLASKKSVFSGNTTGLTINVTGLQPSHKYVADVWAYTGSTYVGNGPHSTVSWAAARTG